MKSLLNVGLWVLSIACFGYAIYHWGWVAKSTSAGPSTGDFAIVISLIIVGVVSIGAWFMMRRKDDDQEISITR